MRKTLVAALFAFVCLTSARPASAAAFVQIPLVTPSYLGSTTLVPITAPPCTNAGTPADPCPAASIVSSMSTGGFTIGFSSPDAGTLLLARAAVPVGFATWNVPPFVETPTPRVIQDEVNLTCAICTLSLAFSSPVQTFGLEMEPDPFSGHTIAATFLNGAATLGTISNTFPSGAGSARLFAATTDQQFTSVSVTIDGTDFAMAQFRFGTTTVPEPGSAFLLLGGLAVIGFRRLRKA